MKRKQERARQKAMGSVEREKVIRDVQLPEAIVVSELANRMAERVGEVVKSLMNMNVQGDRLANAITAAGSEVPLEELQRLVSRLDGLQRLTTSFRFEPGSTRPDAQSRSNITQLARSLEAGAYDARELVFVGFSDGDGPASGNRSIAKKRAEAVRDAVIAAAETANLERTEIEIAAFGEALPMACEDQRWGRQVNRRVEVWVR